MRAILPDSAVHRNGSTAPRLHGSTAPRLHGSTGRLCATRECYRAVRGSPRGTEDSPRRPPPDADATTAPNRGRVFTDEELFILGLLQPHLQRGVNRCALFKKLPGSEQLTAREREVIYWLMQGKRDEEISMINKAAPRTISKHVGAVLVKLVVENRGPVISMVLAEVKPVAAAQRQ